MNHSTPALFILALGSDISKELEDYAKAEIGL